MLPNAVRLEILGGGWTSPLLHIRHPLKSNGARHIYLSKGEEKNLLANEMSLQILGGGQLCTFHQSRYTPSPLGLCRTKTFRWIVSARGKVARGRMRGHKGTVASHQCLSVIPQRFRCVLRVSLPCGQTKSALIHWTSAKG